MTTLLLDAGNSRLKWAWAEGGRLRRRGAAAYLPSRQFDASLRRLMRQSGDSGRILVCSVAGADLDRRLRAAAKAAGSPAPRFARAARCAAGVTNAYVDVWRLGVDRWVALIGARQLFPGEAVCLVGAGTALTVDLLAADGRHHGGLIVPGPKLMAQVLLERTAGIRRRALGAKRPQRGFLARDTRTAIEAGAREACAGLIERALADAGCRSHGTPRLLWSGGAAAELQSLLRGAGRRSDDLVFRGLLALFDSRS
jgi:type III pantothenate kinase